MNYSKVLASLVATVLSAVVAALAGDGLVDASEWVNVALLGAGSLAVLTSPNVPGAAYTKSILAALTAVLTLLVSFISDGLVDLTEWLQLGVAALGALGVYAVPNSGSGGVVNYTEAPHLA